MYIGVYSQKGLTGTQNEEAMRDHISPFQNYSFYILICVSVIDKFWVLRHSFVSCCFHLSARDNIFFAKCFLQNTETVSLMCWLWTESRCFRVVWYWHSFRSLSCALKSSSLPFFSFNFFGLFLRSVTVVFVYIQYNVSYLTNYLFISMKFNVNLVMIVPSFGVI